MEKVALILNEFLKRMELIMKSQAIIIAKLNEISKKKSAPKKDSVESLLEKLIGNANSADEKPAEKLDEILETPLIQNPDTDSPIERTGYVDPKQTKLF